MVNDFGHLAATTDLITGLLKEPTAESIPQVVIASFPCAASSGIVFSVPALSCFLLVFLTVARRIPGGFDAPGAPAGCRRFQRHSDHLVISTLILSPATNYCQVIILDRQVFG